MKGSLSRLAPSCAEPLDQGRRGVDLEGFGPGGREVLVGHLQEACICVLRPALGVDQAAGAVGQAPRAPTSWTRWPSTAQDARAPGRSPRPSPPGGPPPRAHSPRQVEVGGVDRLQRTAVVGVHPIPLSRMASSRAPCGPRRRSPGARRRGTPRRSAQVAGQSCPATTLTGPPPQQLRTPRRALAGPVQRLVGRVRLYQCCPPILGKVECPLFLLREERAA